MSCFNCGINNTAFGQQTGCTFQSLTAPKLQQLWYSTALVKGQGNTGHTGHFLRSVLLPSPHITFYGTEKDQAQKWALHAHKKPFSLADELKYHTLRWGLLVVPHRPFQTWSKLPKIPAAPIRRFSMLEIAEIPRRIIWLLDHWKGQIKANLHYLASLTHLRSEEQFHQRRLPTNWQGKRCDNSQAIPH